jgi:hypothetical protein
MRARKAVSSLLSLVQGDANVGCRLDFFRQLPGLERIVDRRFQFHRFTEDLLKRVSRSANSRRIQIVARPPVQAGPMREGDWLPI